MKQIAYGGIVINCSGRVLLREPKGHFAGYTWTFPKGGPVAGERPEEAALREVLEETGVVAKILERIPGIFEGAMTSNVYFLMLPLQETGIYDRETAQVRWATPEEALSLITQTENELGRDRDLVLLELGVSLWHQIRSAHEAT